MKLDELKEKAIQTGDKIWFRTKEAGRKIATTSVNAVKWAIDNPEKVAGIVGGAAVLDRLVRGVHRNITVRHEIHDKKHRVYDHSLNAYVYTKRPLKARDIERINAERRRTGKRVSEILAEMDLLRR